MSNAPRRPRRGKRILILTAVLIGGLAGVLTLMRVVNDARLRQIRTALQAERGAGTFAVEMVDDLPSPVQRYFQRAIQPGAPLAKSVELEMRGEIRLAPDKPWLPFRARQTIAAGRGFLWEAAAGTGWMSIRGADYRFDGRGKTGCGLWGLIPVVSGTGADIDRSAAGRFALEHCFLPPALLPSEYVRWEEIDGKSARATIVMNGAEYALTFHVDGDGGVLLITLPRWADSGSPGQYSAIPFGCEISGEATFDGITVPTAFNAAWWYGTDNYFEFFRAQITRAVFR